MLSKKKAEKRNRKRKNYEKRKNYNICTLGIDYTTNKKHIFNK